MKYSLPKKCPFCMYVTCSVICSDVLCDGCCENTAAKNIVITGSMQPLLLRT